MDGSDSERIEIELTSHPAVGTRRRGLRASEARNDVFANSTMSAEDSAGDASGEPHDDGKRRLVVTAFATGAVALMLGWVLGRSGGDEPVPEAASATSTARTTTTPPTTREVEGGVAVPTVDVDDLPTITRPTPAAGPTTTLREEGWRPEQTELAVVIDQPLPWEVVAIRTGRVYEINLTTGEGRSLGLPLIPDTGLPWIVEAETGWTVVLRQDGTHARLLQGDADVELPDLANGVYGNGVFRARGEDVFIKIEQDPSSGTRLTYEQVTFEGESLGAPAPLDIPPNAYPADADPAGGVVVFTNNGAFSVSDAESTRLSSGGLIALNAERVVSYECGISLDSCGIYVIDRATGESQPIELSPDARRFVYEAPYGMFGPALEHSMSPDGRFAVVTQFDSSYQPKLLLLDLANGELVEVTAYLGGDAIVWSPDGRYLFTTANGRLNAYDTQTGETIPVAPDFGPIGSFTVREAAAG